MKNNFIESLILDAVSNIDKSLNPKIILEKPRNETHGDISCNIAMQIASNLKDKPLNISRTILENLDNHPYIQKVEIAGPGFINFFLDNKYYIEYLKEIAEKGENYGRQNIGQSKMVNVEYVSANPTGLLHLGHGRNAVIGDTIANLYEWLGYDVTREYYFNNAGNQMNNLVNSIYARYMQAIGEEDYQFPEDGYHGEYIKEIAQELKKMHLYGLKDNNEENRKLIKDYGEKWCFEKISHTLKRLNIKQDNFYNEDSLYSEGKIDAVISDLKNLGLIYEKEGALWMKFSKLGLESDRVIVKSSGEPTYRLPDIAYHREKFKRGFNILVDVFGADHIATIPDVMAGVKALGYDVDKIHVIIHQFVTLTENGQQVKMSKRSGKNYTLDDLLDEVGDEVVRFFLLMRGVSTHLEFDLSIAKESGDKNPVFYLKYAHARISSILNQFDNIDYEILKTSKLEFLEHKSEIDLIKTLIEFENVLKLALEKHEPQVITEYLRNLASTFSTFYHDCRIVGSNENIKQARLVLSFVTKFVLKNGLEILGIKAPDRM